MRILFAVICCAFLVSCGGDDNADVDPGVVCPNVALAGFEIRVANAASGTPLSGVTITAREGSTFEEVLAEVAAVPGFYRGVLEREGSYILVIELDCFQTIITETISVTRDNDPCDTLLTNSLTYSLTEL